MHFKLTNHSLQNHVTRILQEMIGQLNNYKMNHLHNLETITMIIFVDGELATVMVAASGLNANDVIVQHYNLDWTHPRPPSL